MSDDTGGDAFDDRPPYDHIARSIATELVVRALLDRLEQAEPGARAAVLRAATETGYALSAGMPNVAYFRGRVEAALAEVVGAQGREPPAA